MYGKECDLCRRPCKPVWAPYDTDGERCYQCGDCARKSEASIDRALSTLSAGLQAIILETADAS